MAKVVQTLELIPGQVINRLPYPLGDGRLIRGIRRVHEIECWVVNTQNEGQWVTLHDLRQWALVVRDWGTS